MWVPRSCQADVENLGCGDRTRRTASSTSPKLTKPDDHTHAATTCHISVTCAPDPPARKAGRGYSPPTATGAGLVRRVGKDVERNSFGKRDSGRLVGPFAQDNDPATLAAKENPPAGHQAGLGQQAECFGVDLGRLTYPAHRRDAGPLGDQLNEVGHPQTEVLIQRLAQLIQARDRVAVRTFPMLTKQRQDLALDPLAHDVLPSTRLIVDVLPFKTQHVDQQALGQTVL